MPAELSTIRTRDEKLAAIKRELETLSNVELLLYFWRHLAWKALAPARAVQLGTYLAGDIVGVDYGPGVDAKCNQFLEHPAIAIVVGRRGASHLLIAAPKDGDPVAGHSDATLAPVSAWKRSARQRASQHPQGGPVSSRVPLGLLLVDMPNDDAAPVNVGANAASQLHIVEKDYGHALLAL
jgi:hypothetical protein